MNGSFVITEFNDIIMGFLFEDNRLAEIHPFNSGAQNLNPDILGNIYAARIKNIVNNINAAFLEIEGGIMCYYSLSENEGRHIFLNEKKNDIPKEGDLILVQIKKDAMKAKRCEASSALELTCRYTVLNTSGSIGISSKIKDEARRDELKELYQDILGEDYGRFGVIGRTEAEHSDNEEIKKETIILLCKLKEVLNTAEYTAGVKLICEKEKSYMSDIIQIKAHADYDSFTVITDIAPIYDCLIRENTGELTEIKLYSDDMITLKALYSLQSEVEKALKQRVYLKSGAYLVIDRTEALISIDVNTGKAIKGKSSEEHILKVNLEAAAEAARQIRLRNLSGIIIIDFINMKNPDNLTILKHKMQEALARDSVPALFVDFTALGLMEITRKKIRKPLYEVIS